MENGHPEVRVPGAQLSEPLSEDGSRADDETGLEHAAVVQAS